MPSFISRLSNAIWGALGVSGDQLQLVCELNHKHLTQWSFRPASRSKKTKDFMLSDRSKHRGFALCTDGTLIRAEEGPNVLAAPPTTYMAQALFSA